MPKYNISPERVREMCRITTLFFTGQETPPERPKESPKEPPQEPSPGPLFAALETTRT